jgi:hypothetical protein
MDKQSSVVIHYNPHLYNQQLYKRYLLEGFRSLGFSNVEDTIDREAKGDIHICIGPHYAYQQCLGKNTIYLDRCLWGDDLDAVCMGWLNEYGGIIYPDNCDDERYKPYTRGWIDEGTSGAIMLLDYGVYPADIIRAAQKAYGGPGGVDIRPHPATGKKLPPLLDQIKGRGVVIGFKTTALIDAVINGCPVISFDDRSAVWPVAGHDIMDIKRPDRTQWLNNLSYAQWRGEEIQTGEALEYVLTSYDAATSGAGYG